MTDESIFMDGIFYSPVDDKTRDGIKDALDGGISRIDLTDGTWTVMRGAEDSKLSSQNTFARLMERTRDKMQAMPEKMPETVVFDGVTVPRKNFRLAWSHLPNDMEEGRTKSTRMQYLRPQEQAA